jgi:hypothetical protein
MDLFAFKYKIDNEWLSNDFPDEIKRWTETQENCTLGCTPELKTICKEVPLKKSRCKSCYRSYCLSAQPAVFAVPPADNVSQRMCLSARTVLRGILIEDVTILSHRVPWQVAEVARLLWR